MAVQDTAVHYVSCGGTLTTWEASGNPDDFPEHAALHAKIVDLYRQLNALKDLSEKEVGWWTRRRLTRYLRRIDEDFCQMCGMKSAPYDVCRACFWKAKP